MEVVLYFQESKPKKHGKDKKHRHRKDSEGKKVSKPLTFISQSIQSGRPASYLDIYTRRGTWEVQRIMGRVRQKMRWRVHFSLLPRCFVRLEDLISKLGKTLDNNDLNQIGHLMHFTQRIISVMERMRL